MVDAVKAAFVATAHAIPTLRPLKALAVEALRRGGRLCQYYALHY